MEESLVAFSLAMFILFMIAILVLSTLGYLLFYWIRDAELKYKEQRK